MHAVHITELLPQVGIETH